MLFSESSKVIYLGNDTANTFAVPFIFQKKDDLQIIVLNTLNENKFNLVLNTDYTVVGENELLGGSITLVNLSQSYLVAGNLRSDFKILIKRNPLITQDTDFRNAGRFFAETHENRFDRQTYIDQKIKEILDRGLFFDEFSSKGPGVLPEPENGQYLAWDGVTGKLKNASTTIDPLLLDSEDITYDNSSSTLVASNVEAAIDELDVKIENLEAQVLTILPTMISPKMIWNNTLLDDTYVQAPSFQDGQFDVWQFSSLDKTTVALIGYTFIPYNYTSGVPKLRFKYYSKIAAGTARWQYSVSLFRNSIATPLDSFASFVDGASQVIAANTIYQNLFDLTNGSFQVGTTSLLPGDILRITILNNGTGNALSNDVFVLKSDEVYI